MANSNHSYPLWPQNIDWQNDLETNSYVINAVHAPMVLRIQLDKHRGKRGLFKIRSPSWKLQDLPCLEDPFHIDFNVYGRKQLNSIKYCIVIEWIISIYIEAWSLSTLIVLRQRLKTSETNQTASLTLKTLNIYNNRTGLYDIITRAKLSEVFLYLTTMGLLDVNYSSCIPFFIMDCTYLVWCHSNILDSLRACLASIMYLK